jgi:conjugal transfer pilus assembly protein TraU
MWRKLLIDRGKPIVVVLAFIFALFLKVPSLYAECKATFVNLFSDVDWTGVFPVKIGGVTIKKGVSKELEALEKLDEVRQIVCFCKPKGKPPVFGLAVSFWEPARVAEIVKDPWCFPLLGGLKLENQPVEKAGRNQKPVPLSTHKYFAQAHWYMFSVWNLLDLFMDVPCIMWDGFDIAYMTELDPLWQNDNLSMFIHPEVLLFANPIAQSSCIADSVGAQVGRPIDQLFWCMGSWGRSYPMTGTTSQSTIIEGSANLAGRILYKLSREGLMWDPGVDLCGAVLTPVWVKSHYKMHLMKPVRSRIIPVGQSGLIWGMAKNPPWGTKKGAPDNFDWLIFRKVKCCVGPLRFR